MTSIRVWNLESDHDLQAVKFLEGEFASFRQLGDLAIRKTGRSAFRKCHRKGAPISSSLRKAIEHYLKQDDYIIFVLDSEQRQRASQPLANEVKKVVKNSNFSDRVFFASDIQEGKSPTPTQWQDIISHFRSEIERDRKQFRDEWDKTMTRFHDAFADTPEEEVIRDFEEALAEVRRERT